MQTTGSKSLSEIAKGAGVTGGKFRLVIEGEASPIAGAMVAPTVRLASGDFFLALARAGAVGEAIAESAARFALARAKGEAMGEAETALAKRFEARAKELAEVWAKELPPIEREASLRIKAEVSLA